MWILSTLTQPEKNFYLIPEKQKYLVGKLGRDLVLSGDTSISRSHAILYFAENAVDELTLEDTTSKYGTFHNDGIINNRRISKEEKVVLKDGDRLRFGVMKNLWQVVHVPLISLSSTFLPFQNIELQQKLNSLGGKMLKNWERSCTHLTISKPMITAKILYAILDKVPIVTINFWDDLLKTVRNNQGLPLPVPENYAPTEIDLRYKPERKQLFNNWTIVFMNRKQYETYSIIVQKAGGTCKDLKCGVQKALLLKKNVIVIAYISTTQSQSSQIVSSVEEFLNSHSRRLIPEFEIGEAIIACSTERYCNPDYKEKPKVLYSKVQKELTEEKFTETEFKMNSESYDLFIPETEEDSNIEISKSTEEKEEFTHYMCVTESAVEDESQNKRKRSSETQEKVTNRYECDDNDNDDELFHFSKRPNLEENRKQNTNVLSTSRETRSSTKIKNNAVSISPQMTAGGSRKQVSPRSNIKPLPMKAIPKKSVEGFLQKSQTLSTSNAAKTHSNTTEADSPTKHKRPRIAVISDDDDDDDDLFKFDATNSKKSRLASTNPNNSDEELFEFGTTSSDDKGLENTNAKDNTKEVKQQNQVKSFSMPKPKPLPQKINVDGWFSCSIKTEDSNGNDTLDCSLLNKKDNSNENFLVKLKEEDIAKSHNQWLESMKGGFEVRKKIIALKPRLDKDYLADQSLDSNCTVSESLKNFKSFVKKRNVHPQQKVIKTVSRSLGQLRLR